MQLDVKANTYPAAAGGDFFVAHEAFAAFLFVQGIKAAAHPVETSRLSQFIAHFAKLSLQRGDVVELLFQIRFFGDEPLQFAEEESAVALGGGELLFGGSDLSFEIGDGGVKLIGLFVQIGVGGLKVGNLFVARRDFLRRGVGGRFGVGLGLV